VKNLLLLVIAYCVFTSLKAQNTSLTYAATTTNILNPDRGLYDQFETYVSTSNRVATPLTSTGLNNTKGNGKSLILRLYYLDRFKTTNLTSNFLTDIQTDFTALRTAGMRCILRFCYSTETVFNNADANKARVLAHIAQLKPTLIANANVITVVQAGFIGAYGEWYYTSADFINGLDPFGNPIPNYTARKEVTDAVLDAVGSSRMVQIRTPYYKQNMYNNGTTNTGASAAITNAEAHNGSSRSRAAHHNDCFVASPDDIGTYIDIPNDKAYLAAETNYLANGGETCTDDWFGTATAGTYSNCTAATTDLANLHFSYLNDGYHPNVLARWKMAMGAIPACYNTIRNKLGYRFEMTNSTTTTTGRPGYNFTINLNLQNTGYAAPFNKRVVNMVLKNAANTTTYKIPLSVDERFWLPGSTININETVGIGSIANGNYNLYIEIADTAAAISNNNNYKIRFANTLSSTDVWDNTLGYNLIRSNISVNTTNNTGTVGYSGTQWFGTAAPLSNDFLQFAGVQNASGISLSWKISQLLNGLNFEVERSTDGINFVNVGNVPIAANSLQYNWQSNFTSNDRSFYRIKYVKANGNKVYSNIISFSNNNGSAVLNVQPNPAKNNITLNFVHNTIEASNLNIYNASGKLVFNKRIQLQNGNNSISDNDISHLANGTYILAIATNNNNVQKARFIIAR
jgi:hypothetical protein